jgi:hypothetical protein
MTCYGLGAEAIACTGEDGAATVPFAVPADQDQQLSYPASGQVRNDYRCSERVIAANTKALLCVARAES